MVGSAIFFFCPDFRHKDIQLKPHRRRKIRLSSITSSIFYISNFFGPKGKRLQGFLLCAFKNESQIVDDHNNGNIELNVLLIEKK